MSAEPVATGLVATTARLYLASQSPRRAELLQQINLPFQTLTIEVDETPQLLEVAEDYVVRVALAKARAGWQRVESKGLAWLPVLGADTAVSINGEILGKPVDRNHGCAMLKQLSATRHRVMTAICFCYRGQEYSALSISDVCFRALDDPEIEAYWETGEPQGKAGGYAIQGCGAVFVEQIKGSYSAIVGLPLLETSQLLMDIEKTAHPD